MSGGELIALSLGAPLVGAVLIALTGKSEGTRDAISVLTAILTFGIVATLVPDVRGEAALPELTFYEIVPNLPLAFKVEPLGMLFGLIASGLWIVTSAYSIGYMRGHHEKHQTRFTFCFAIAIFAAIGAAFSANLFTLFIFYEILTLSTYPLITHHGTPEALRAGRIYLGILLSTSVGFLFLAIAWTWALASTTEFQLGGILRGKAAPEVIGILVPLYFFGVGKAALMPFHRWLPNAMVAPTPVSALLHAVAVVKTGVFAILKIAVYVFGIDLLRETPSSTVMAYVAGGTILISSLVAMTKDNLKARLAYSTISQLSYIVLGAALATSMGIMGGAMHIAMHAFGKITLFFCAGAIMVAAHKTEISTMAGIGRRMPVTLFAFLIGSLSVIGVPPFGGSWSKFFLALGAADAKEYVLVAVLMVSSLLNIAYLIPVVLRGYFLPEPPDPHGHGHGPGIKEAPMLCLIPICVTAAGCAVLFFTGDSIYQLLIPIVSGGTP